MLLIHFIAFWRINRREDSTYNNRLLMFKINLIDNPSWNNQGLPLKWDISHHGA
jgi:hypothetical protein